MNTESYTLLAYGIYTAGITTTTLLVTRMIFAHGRVFITQGFDGDEGLARATGSMLRTQFVLTAVAVMLLLLRFTKDTPGFLTPAAPDSPAGLFEALSVKLGLMLMIIGGMHFLTLRLINRIRSTGSIL